MGYTCVELEVRVVKLYRNKSRGRSSLVMVPE
jgi:hypothetical protein